MAVNIGIKEKDRAKIAEGLSWMLRSLLEK